MLKSTLPQAEMAAAPRTGRALFPKLLGAIMAAAVVLLAVSVTVAFTATKSAAESALPAAYDAKWLSMFCIGTDQCATGDFNGDGRDDVLAFVATTNPSSGAIAGNVWVALSTGTGFTAPAKWLDSFCTGSDVCKVGDVNGDGRDDLVNFKRGSSPQVWVALSTGDSFFAATVWHNLFCAGTEQCDVGDFNGDGRADIVTFLRSNYSSSVGDVNVALSTGAGFGTSKRWNDYFCIGSEQCQVGDFNGDHKTDILAFSRGSSADAFVALSTGSSFATGTKWNDVFCPLNETCASGDFNGDGKDDAITFLRSDYSSTNPSSVGDVFVALSDGSKSFTSGPKWSDYFCTDSEMCKVGDFNGDGRKDLVRFVRDTNLSDRGGVYVAFAAGSAPAFVSTGYKWADYLCIGSQECATADVNGDGLADAIAFVRDTQSGTARGDVNVALSSGGSFGATQKWAENACTGQQVCKLADVNGDGLADLVSFDHTTTGSTPGDVNVAFSTGSGFADMQKWHDYFCVGGEVCNVGDFNGDGRADIVTFLRSAYSDSSVGDVYVAQSTGYSFGTSKKWHEFFCIESEQCQVGDFNGDNRDDVVSFVRGSSGDVYVALSSGSSFGAGNKWNDFFCAGSESCATGDFNGDGRDDAITFLRSDYASSNPSSVGNVVVALSTGADSFVSGPAWNSFFCIDSEVCRTGDFDGDGRRDVATFIRSTQSGDKLGDIYVALANGQAYVFGVPPTPPTPTSTPTVTPTPTITPTPTATATRIPTEIAKYRYLPLIVR